VIRRASVLLLISISILAGGARRAEAEFGFAPGSVSFQILDAAGNPEGRAGGHPDRVDLQFAFNLLGEAVDGNVKEIVTELPPGMIGNTTGLPTCPRAILDSGFEEKECPPDSQVGVATLTAPGQEEAREIGIYNAEPVPGQIGELGQAFVAKFPLEITLGAGGAVGLRQSELPQGIPLSAVKTELWGVPADHQEEPGPRTAFLTLPTRCEATPPTVTIRARSWQEPDVWRTASASAPVPLDGCAGLRFEPEVQLALTAGVQDEPTGLGVTVVNPSTEAPDQLVSSGVESLSVALPEGVSVSPGGLETVALCGAAAFALESTGPPRCPAAARIGSATVTAAALPSPMAGSVFLGEGRSPAAFAVLVAVEGFGTALKLEGELRADPRTGRLTVTFPKLPPLPFGELSLDLLGGARALLATPVRCGATSAAATLVPLSGTAAVTRTEPISIGRLGGGSGCPAGEPFEPKFSAGTTGLGAGRPTDFVVDLERQPGEAALGGFELSLPNGLSAALGAVERCGAAAAAAGTCPAASRVGSVLARVGSGSALPTLSGSAYLTGPYRGAPFGIAVALPASLGPFDAGTIVARGTIRIRPLSGRVSIAMDPLPALVDGISIRLRSLALELDREGFVRNPTSCAPAEVGAALSSTTGARVARSSPFAVKGCDRLSFHPRVAMALGGGGGSGAEGLPLTLTLRSPAGGTNLRRLDLPLPAHLQSDIAKVRELCARGEALHGRCRAGAQVGTALARSPLVAGPLRGKVFLVQPHGTGLPDLWTSLAGEGLKLAVRAKVVTEGGRLQAQLVGLPDLPLSYFRMRLAGGPHGLLRSSADLCRGPGAEESVTAALEGQDRAYRLERVRVQHPGCGGSKRRGGGA
jgi:hypothetical protein